jgi:hypothetical protein
MIARVFEAGRSFRETSHYLAHDLERALVLHMEGVRAWDYKQMADDFELQHRIRMEVEKPVFHAVLSFPSGENPGDRELVSLSQEFMEGIGMVNTQAAFVKHMDTSHVHVHILANRVSNNGDIIGKGMTAERAIRTAQKLTKDHGLWKEEKKNMELINQNALNPVEARRYRLYEAIRDELPNCRELDELKERLLQREITTRYRLDPTTGARVGISFRIENYAFKGSQVDTDFSIRGLERQLAQQRVLKQEEKLEQEQRQEIMQEQRLELKQGQRRGLRMGM